MPETHIDNLLGLWASSQKAGDEPPFRNHTHLHSIIDSVTHGDLPWQSFSVRYTGALPEGEAPPWMLAHYDVWFRDPRGLVLNQLANPDFKDEIDYSPVQIFDRDGKRVWTHFMTGNWTWRQANEIAKDPVTHGAMLVPIILGSDKTTVSVATGQTEYYPLYISNGNIHNNVRRAHRNAVSLVRFLAIPKTDREYSGNATFRKFRMTTPEIVRCPDGHLRRAVYALGPYIADYPEQVMLACVVSGWCPRCGADHNDLDAGGSPRSHACTRLLMDTYDVKTLWEDHGIIDDVLPFTSHFPRADIHELLSFDILHQVIKGTFKDHLVTWVEDYIKLVHTAADAAAIIADIDQRIAAAPAFPGLRWFSDGRGFKQWTGDDSKALMKVYLPAIVGHVPAQMVRAISAFMDFCYLVRRSTLNETTLDEMRNALARFHADWVIFETVGVRPTGFSLPRQHSLTHYCHLVQEFGAPNGLCSSITESKHIKAVKEPWRRSSHFNALGQMLLTNQRLDKIAAARVDFDARGMLNGPCLSKAAQLVSIPIPLAPPPPTLPAGDYDGPRVDATVTLAKTKARGYPKHLHALAEKINRPDLPNLIRRFLFDQLNPDADAPGADVDLANCPHYDGKVSVFHSALAIFYSPSDPSGVGGMHRHRIRSVPSWHNGPPRNDCVFVQMNAAPGMRGLHAAQVLLFFFF
ncbi:hypothetical protein EW146_g7529 [Bondarzewia mesenterica]|uniref:Uncharacterized protein n=1 Tax=Bondarzewia mesenterica TaxID=1095465 RepID=A0A4S4LR68_9AGAM|nr:hypothetical protein EW146_g7529 [Bondarzewia mesenterica]